MEFWAIAVHVVYGGAFVATGLALGFQARLAVTDEPIPRRSLWLLAAFLVSHGAADFTDLSDLIADDRLGAMGQFGRLALIGISFALLLAFGIGLLRMTPRGRAGGLALLALALVAWPSFIAAALRVGIGPVEPTGTLVDGLEAATRLGLGVPAAVAAALGVRAAAAHTSPHDWSAAVLVRAAAFVFGAYALFAGLVVPPAGFPPASVVNELTFRQTLLLPPQLFRAMCAIGIGLLLSEAFIRAAVRRMHSEVEHLRDEFIALVAHDLRTPLGAIENGASLLERLPPRERGTEQEHRGLRTIHSSVRTMQRIVDDLLQASLLDANRLVVNREPTDLRALVTRTADVAAAAVPSRRIVVVGMPDELPPVLADPFRVEQVLGNLLSNAVKYSPEGSTIRIEVAAQGPDVVVSIANEGEGIPSRDLPRVFSRHYRTRSAEKGRTSGLGLGLYIARGLVEAQDGRIWAESKLGLTTFRFTIPIAPRVAGAAHGDTDEGGGTKGPSARRNHP